MTRLRPTVEAHMKNLYFSAFLVLVIPTFSASCASDHTDPTGTGGSSTTGGTGGSAETGDTDDTDDTEDSSGETGGQGGAHLDVCADLDPSDCEANNACQPVFGYKPSPGKHPASGDWDADSKTYFDCRYVGPPIGPCSPSYTCAHEPAQANDCWTFPDTCYPQNWTRVNCDDPCLHLGEGGAAGGSSTP